MAYISYRKEKRYPGSILCEKGHEHKTSMLLHIINKRKTEVEFLKWKDHRTGKEHKIQTPLNLLIYGVIKALEGCDNDIV